MDARISKYIQYRLRTLNERQKELQRLLAKREELRNNVIDASPDYMDGQPRGKGTTSSPTERKVIQLERLDKRIEKLEKELAEFKAIEQKIYLMGRIPRIIYERTIKGETLNDLVAAELGITDRALYIAKAKITSYIAKELGEYIDEKELEEL